MSRVDEPSLPVGEEQRTRSAAALRRLGAQGRLESHEVDERAAGVRVARTRGELAALLADVLPDAALAELVGAAPDRRPLGPGYSWDNPLIVTARWRDERRLVGWDVPPFIEADPLAGSVKLNFVGALPVSLVIDLLVEGRSGNLVVVVPEDWGVDASGVTKGVGWVRIRVDARGVPDSPRLLVHGHNRRGNLVVRHPNRFDDWQQARAARRA